MCYQHAAVDTSLLWMYGQSRHVSLLQGKSLFVYLLLAVFARPFAAWQRSFLHTEAFERSRSQGQTPRSPMATLPGGCRFPFFREMFWKSAMISDDADSDSISSSPSSSSNASTPQQPRVHPKALKALDLRALPRDEGPPTELRARRDKFAFFEQQCSEITPGLFLGSDAVARNWETLEAAGITHVVNCVGFIYPAYFESKLTYKVLYLQDTPGEEITAVLYDTFDFIQTAVDNGGKVFIHCSQGVSRSTTLLIAYLMWRSEQPYDEVFQQVKAARGVANPNIGFICQLLNWYKRRHNPVEGCRLYRVAPQCSAAPTYLVLKVVQQPQLSCLDPRGAFLIHCPSNLYLWQGKQCPISFVEAAQQAAAALLRYESTPSAETVQQGQEPAALLTALGSDSAGFQALQECQTYNDDYQMYAEAVDQDGSEQASEQTTGEDMVQASADQAAEDDSNVASRHNTATQQSGLTGQDISHPANRQDASNKQSDLAEEEPNLATRTGSFSSGEVSLTDRQGSLSSRRPKTPRSELRTSLEGFGDPAPSPNARSRKMRKGARDGQPD